MSFIVVHYIQYVMQCRIHDFKHRLNYCIDPSLLDEADTTVDTALERYVCVCIKAMINL